MEFTARGALLRLLCRMRFANALGMERRAVAREKCAIAFLENAASRNVFLAFKMDSCCGYGLQELIVVAYGDERSGEFRQCSLERFDGMNVQVVGGLVGDNQGYAIDDSASDGEFAQLTRAGAPAFEDAVGVGVEPRNDT